MKLNDPTDAELVSQTLAGSNEAFGRLFDRHARLVRAVVGSVSLDWNAVEDMVQESFLRAFQNLPKLRKAEFFGSWISGIARRVARERKRSLRRERHASTYLPAGKIGFSSERNMPIEDLEQNDLL